MKPRSTLLAGRCSPHLETTLVKARHNRGHFVLRTTRIYFFWDWILALLLRWPMLNWLKLSWLHLRALVCGATLLAALVAGVQMMLAQAGTAAGLQLLGQADAVTGVRLRFDTDVVAVGAVGGNKTAPITLQCSAQGEIPPPKGNARWNSPREWVWEFSAALRGAQHCTAAINPSFRTSAGLALGADALERGARFAIAGPRIVASSPERWEHVDEEQIFVLRLNAPARTASISEHARCRSSDTGESMGVRLIHGKQRQAAIAAANMQPASQEEAERTVALTCQRRLNPATQVQLFWTAGIASADGAALAQTQLLEWEVRPAFSAHMRCQRENPRSGCLPIAPVEVQFTAPVPWKWAAQMRLKPTSGAAAVPTPLDADGSVIGAQALVRGADERMVSGVRFAAPLQEAAAYQIEMPEGLRDDAGRALVNASAWPLKLRTSDAPALARFASERFGVIERTSADAQPALLPITVRRLAEPASKSPNDPSGVQGTPPRNADFTPQLRSLRLSDDADIIGWWALLERFDERHISRTEAAKHAGGSRALPAPRDGDDRYIDTRAVSLLHHRSDAQPLALPAQAFEQDKNREARVIGIALPQPGFHVLELQSPVLGAALLDPHVQPRSMFVRTSALVTDLGVHFKGGAANSLVWVTRLSNAQVVRNARVQVSDCHGHIHATGQTGADGTLALEQITRTAPQCSDHPRSGAWFVSARLDDEADMAFVWSDANDGIEPWRFNQPVQWSHDERARWVGHSVLDRSLLRAGETVSMKHYLREQTPTGLSLPQRWPQFVSITHEGSGQRLTQSITWNATAAGSRNATSALTLPRTAKLGEYRIALHFVHPEGGQHAQDADDDHALPASIPTGSFRVEAFRTPVFHGQITVGQPQSHHANSALSATEPLIAPATFDKDANPAAPWALPVAVQLHYLNGGAAQGHAVQLSATVQDAPEPRFERWSHFSFQPHTGQVNSAQTAPAHDDDASQASNLPENAPMTPLGSGTRLVLDQTATTLDTHGAAHITAPIATPQRPQQLQALVRFADPSGEIHTLHTQRTLWPAQYIVGIHAADWVQAGMAQTVRLLAVDASGRAQAGAAVELRAVRVSTTSTRQRLVGGFYAYHNERHTHDMGRVCEGKTNAQGQLSCTLKADAAGEIELIATVRDSAGRRSHSTTTVWVSAVGEPLWFGGHNHDRMDIVPESLDDGRRAWQVGQTAKLHVHMPFRQATALLSVEREGILHREVIELSADRPTIELPIQPGWGPNVFVSVLALRGRVHEVPWYSFFTWGFKTPLQWWDAFWHGSADYAAPTAMVDLSRPAFRMGVTQLRIEDPATVLQVQVRAEKSTLRPRETARIHIQAQRADGTPAAGASVALAAVDDALLQLMPNHSWQLHERLWQPRRWGVETATAQMQIVGRRHYGLKAAAPGGGGGADGSTRELLDTLLSWQPTIVLDAQGRASVSVPMNDALSRFTVAVVADDGAQAFGSATTALRTTQDLQLISALPPVVREGDAFVASFTVRNTTEQVQRVQLQARMGAQDLSPRTVDIAAQSSAVVQWEVTAPTLAAVRPAPERGGSAQSAAAAQTPDGSFAAFSVPSQAQQPLEPSSLLWHISAHSSDAPASLHDALQVQQRLLQAVPVQVQHATLVQLQDTRTLPIAQPQGALPARGGLRIALSERMGNVHTAALRQWWTRYPHTCLEQSTARAIGLDDIAAWQRLMEQLPTYLDADGLAHYFPNSDARTAGSDILSAHLLRVDAVLRHQDPRWALPAHHRQRLQQGLQRFIAGHSEHFEQAHWSPVPTALDRDVRKLAAIAALAVDGRATAAMLEGITIAPHSWPTHALLDWLTILDKLPQLPNGSAHRQTALDAIAARQNHHAQHIAFDDSTEHNAWWWHMQNADTANARWLLHTVGDARWDGERARIVQGLIAAQRGGAWQTTTANTWGLLALRQFSQHYEKAPVTGTTHASLGRHSTSWAWHVSPPPHSAQTPDRSMGTFGAGSAPDAAPSATAAATAFLPWPDAPSAQPEATLTLRHNGSGAPWVSVQTLAAVPQPQPQQAGYRVEKTITAHTQAQSGRWQRGDIVRVSLRIWPSVTMDWVALNDPIPAGASLLGNGLGRDEPIDTPSGIDDDTPTFIERDHDALRAYWAHVPQGQPLQLSYHMRLNNAGTFHMPPTRVEALYAPATFGHLPNAAFTIVSEPRP